MSRTVDRSCERTRAWTSEAVRVIEADANRSADTHLLRYPLPPSLGVDLYLKDESTHPTGSLKHRLARSLFLHALCNGWVSENTPVIEASSGSTAVSEAYFASLLDLPFIAVMPRSTSPEKIALIERQGGRCHFVDDPTAIYDESRRLARELGGHFMDQFTHAEGATDWRGNNNIAESIFEQLSRERHPEPAWVVAGAGTGGTSATLGRYVRYRRHRTRLAVVDPWHSVFFEAWRDGDVERTCEQGSLIEGIGRPRVEPSFVGQAVDRMSKVADAESIAAVRCAERVLGRRVGGSTGTNLWAAFELVSDMAARGERGSIVTLLCDGGERYAHTYFDDEWVAARGLDLTGPLAVLDRFHDGGGWTAAG